MSLSSGKASGKIACDWPHDAELQNAYKRIAELEAELAGARSALEMALSEKNFHRRNAEKAEAEVERLKEELRYCHAGHPKGGGRESESLLSQKPRENDENRRVSDDGLYVVSPASRKATPRTDGHKCPYCGDICYCRDGSHPDCEDYESAARKERDEG